MEGVVWTEVVEEGDPRKLVGKFGIQAETVTK